MKDGSFSFKQYALRLKSIAQERLFLEQNPYLSKDPDLQIQYDCNQAKLHDWNMTQMEDFKTQIKYQPKFEYGELNHSMLT